MFKILVLGAGSIGIFLGAKLYVAGHNVILYGRRKLKSIADPILINSEVYKIPPRIYQLEADEYDVIFVTTKLYHVKQALEQIRKYNFSPQIIAFIQNGLVDESFYEEVKDHSGFVTLSVFNGYNLTDNKITAAKTELGWQVEDTLAGKRMCELLIAAGINCNATPNLSQLRAEKLIYNAALNALSALEKKTLGELIANKKLKEIIEGIVKESYEVLKGDYNLPDVESLREKIYRLISQTRSHYSSMYQDFVSGRNTEVEFFNGFIIKLGKEKGIPTPHNQQVYLSLVEQEATRALNNPKRMLYQEF